MGRKDTITKDYMKDCEVFADAFNYMLYGGRQVIMPQMLRPTDTVQTAVPYGADGAGIPVQRYRDGLKYLSSMTDGAAASLILGLENQSETHYAMPIKNMLYDAIQYASQVERAAASHRRAKDAKGHNAGEYLGGFYKEDQLIPVITLVVCFHADRWDGPLSLHEMLLIQDRKVLPFVQDYHIHLIEPFSIKPAQLKCFHSSLREVISFIKYSGDSKMLEEVISRNERFQHLERKAAMVIKECANVDIKITEKEGHINLCKAIIDMKREQFAEGKKTGVKQGRKQGVKQGVKKGVKQGVKQGIDRTNKLIQILIADGRQDDLIKSTHDSAFQQKLFREYHI